MKNIVIINGPNLNLVGTREPTHYGTRSMADIENHLKNKFAQHVIISFYQNNSEGLIIDYIQNLTDTDAIIINPGALTHTSIALRDALLAINIPGIEVHISNIYKREHFRHHSYFSDISLGVISGFGALSYELAVIALIDYLEKNS
jgi:3-dehydroquinate dehydratase-2